MMTGESMLSKRPVLRLTVALLFLLKAIFVPYLLFTKVLSGLGKIKIPSSGWSEMVKDITNGVGNAGFDYLSNRTQCRRRLTTDSRQCYSGSKPRRRAPPFVARFGVVR